MQKLTPRRGRPVSANRARGLRTPRPASTESLENRLLFAFSGIGNNDGFLNTNQFFDLQAAAGSSNSSIISAPILTDSATNIAHVQAYFDSIDGGNPLNPAQPLAVQLTGPIANSTAAAIFDSYKVSFVYAEYTPEGFNFSSGNTAVYNADAAQYANLVTQVTGGGSLSGGATISGTDFGPLNTDRTSPNPSGGPTATAFANSHLTVATPMLLPGDASFKTPSQLGGTSNAPNIRSSLFMLPLTRLSETSDNAAPGAPIIPLVSRFDDFNNPAFATGGTVNGVPQFNANSGIGAHQLLSRDDFQALLLQYRLRGATSFELSGPGVEGYNYSQMESDAVTGWNLPTLAAYFADPTAAPLTFNTTIYTDGVAKTMENAGVAYSGIVTGTANGVVSSNSALAILISNLDDTAHVVTFPGSVASGSIAGSFNVGAHSHELLQFIRVGSMWQLVSSTPVFNDGSLASSDGVGVGGQEQYGPTAIFLSTTSISNTAPAGSVVATISDPARDGASGGTVSLVAGTGSTDNGSFTIANGNQLKINATPAQGSYSIRLRATDTQGAYIEQAFTLTVASGASAPVNAGASTLPASFLLTPAAAPAVATFSRNLLQPSIPPNGLTNSSFETGDFTGYSTTGNVTVESTPTLFETPTDGTYEALLQTTGASTGSTANPAAPVSVAALDTFLGTGTVLTGNAAGFVDGSALAQTFTASAGVAVSFDSSFLTNELTSGGNADQAFAFLLHGSTVVAQQSLGTPSLATNTASSLDPIFVSKVNYATTTFGASDFATTGTYALEFVVLNAANAAVDSGLLVDHIRASQAPSLTVTTTQDVVNPNDGVTSLREAINYADTLGAGTHAITFDPVVFAAAQVITLDSALGTLELSDATGTTTITGPSAGVTIDGNHVTQIFKVDAGVTATLSGLTIANGKAADGGGILNNGTLLVSNDTFTGNAATNSGGAISNNAMLTVLASTFSNNTAVNEAGGIASTPGSTLIVGSSTFNNNSAQNYGGGLLVNGATATFTNCTFGGNFAVQSGGAIEDTGNVTVLDCTFTGNQAGPLGGGGAIDNFDGGYTLKIGSSILAGNLNVNAPDVANSVTSLGHNLIGQTTQSSGWIASDLTGNAANPLNPLLASLGNYGGPTATMPPLPGSPAIGAGVPVTGVTIDQRGSTRSTTAPTIGAYESEGFSATVTGGSPQSTTVNTSFASPLQLTVTSNNPLFSNLAGGVVGFAAPASVASATLSSATATLNSSSVASVTATANTIAGAYSVTTSIGGINTSAAFSLTNTPGAAASVTVSSGAGQSTTVGTAFPSSLVVVVKDAFGNAVPGASVTFTSPPTGASASLTGSPATTGIDGSASVTATANTVAGAYAVTATVAGVATPASFNLTNTAGAAASISTVSGSVQSTTVGTTFASPLVVFVADIYGNAVANITVTLAGSGSGASASAPSAITGNNGQAGLTAKANTVAGSYTATASFAGVQTPASFSLTNTPGAAASVTVVSGSNQSATDGAAFGSPLVVVVQDLFGNAVPGASVTFTSPATGPSATLTGSPATTGSDGTASVTATANSNTGTYTVSASVNGVASPATFSLTNTAAPTSTNLSSNLDPSIVGQNVTFTATVSANTPGLGTPTGQVQFCIDGSAYMSPVTLVNGQAQISDAALPVGSHNITAKYISDSVNFANSHTATPLVQVVNKPAPIFSGLSAPSLVLNARSVQVGGFITASIPGRAPSGSVTVTVTYASGPNAGRTFATATGVIGSAGKFGMIINTTFSSVGKYNFTYSFAGDANYSAFSQTTVGTVTYNVASRATALSHTAVSVQVQLTDINAVNVSSAGTTVTATGYALASSPNNVMALPPVNGTGVFSYANGSYQLTLNVSALTKGSYLLYLTIAGDSVQHAVQFTVG